MLLANKAWLDSASKLLLQDVHIVIVCLHENCNMFVQLQACNFVGASAQRLTSTMLKCYFAASNSQCDGQLQKTNKHISVYNRFRKISKSFLFIFVLCFILWMKEYEEKRLLQQQQQQSHLWPVWRPVNKIFFASMLTSCSFKLQDLKCSIYLSWVPLDRQQV